MDPGLIKLLEDDEDDNGPPVSGAAVDAYTERLKGVLGDEGSGAVAAYGLARAGNGSLKPITSPAPSQATTTSSVPPATGSTITAVSTGSAPLQHGTTITHQQWNNLSPQQRDLLLQRYRAAQLQQQKRQQQSQQQSGTQAQKRPANISQGISFGALMPLLQPHLPPEQSERLSALYQRFKQNEITREDFVRGARVIVGDQVLVQTIRQMHVKQQQQTGTQQQAGSQQSGSSSHVTGTQQSVTISQPVTPSGLSTQASPAKLVPDTKSIQSTIEQSSAISSPVLLQAQSLQQQQQQHQDQQLAQAQTSSQQPSGQTQPQQSKGASQPSVSSQSSQSKPSLLLQSAFPPRQNALNVKVVEQSHQGVDTSQGVSQSAASPILQQVKNEVDKAVGAPQASRPLQVAATSPFGNFQARPPTLSTPHTVGGQPHPGLPSQVPRAATPLQFGGLPQSVQPKPGFPQLVPDTTQQGEQKPLSKYAKAKLRKEQKRVEEEERMRKMQEDERLRRQQQSNTPAMGSHPQSSQPAQALSIPVATPQPHPKLMESKQQGVQTIPAIKQELQLEQNAGGGPQRTPVQSIQAGQVGTKAPGQMQLLETGSQATPTVPIDPSANVLSAERSNPNPPPAANPITRYPGLSGLSTPSQQGAAGAAPTGTSTVQSAGPIRQPYALGSEANNPASSVNTSNLATVPKDATSSGIGGLRNPTPQALHALSALNAAKTPQKKPAVAVGQKKPGEVLPLAAQPASKKQKTQGPEADQSIDQLNDVTAVSGVNLKEEEEKLLAGPNEESRTTEAMRKFVQEEEERLFLERGPLRVKAQAIAAKCGLRSVNEDVERCLSMSAEERLRSMLYKIIKYSNQRCDTEKDAHNISVTSDTRRRVLMMKKKAKEAMEKKQAEENERLRKLNEKKDKGALADGDNEDLRLKAQKAQQEEDDKMRAKAANVAARAAVGATDMLSKWQMMAAQGLAKRQGGDTANDAARVSTADETSGTRDQDRRQENGEPVKATGPGRTDTDGDGASGSALSARPPGPGPGAGRGNAMRRIGAAQAGRQPRTITMKDVIACLEREPQMAKSALLYRLYERDRKPETSRRL